MAEETFLRSLSKQIPMIKQLANDLKFKSDEFDELLLLHEDKEITQQIDVDILTEYEVKIFEKNQTRLNLYPRMISKTLKHLSLKITKTTIKRLSKASEYPNPQSQT